MFTLLVDEPVAAASIGQVYKARLRNGKVVALSKCSGRTASASSRWICLSCGVGAARDVVLRARFWGETWI